MQAARKGRGFDTDTGAPESMVRAQLPVTWFDLACRFVDLKWPHAAAKSRTGIADALATATPVLVTSRNARANQGIGKSDPLDAQRIAAAVLALDICELRRPRRAEGVRAALRVLVAARDHMTAERTATLNALIALLRVVDLGIDARKPVSGTQIATVARRRARDEELGAATARAEAIRPAKRVLELDEQVSVNSARTVIWRRPAATWNMSWTTRRSFGRASPPRTSEGSSTPSTPGNEHPPALNGDRPASVDRKAGWNPVLRLTGTRRNGRATDFATPAIRAGRSPGYSAGMILDCGVGRACAPVGARQADGRSNARSPGCWYIAA